MNIDGATLLIIVLILFSLGPLFGAVREKGPSLRRRKPQSTFRQFPLHDDAEYIED